MMPLKLFRRTQTQISIPRHFTLSQIEPIFHLDAYEADKPIETNGAADFINETSDADSILSIARRFEGRPVEWKRDEEHSIYILRKKANHPAAHAPTLWCTGWKMELGPNIMHSYAKIFLLPIEEPINRMFVELWFSHIEGQQQIRVGHLVINNEKIKTRPANIHWALRYSAALGRMIETTEPFVPMRAWEEAIKAGPAPASVPDPDQMEDMLAQQTPRPQSRFSRILRGLRR